MFVRRESFTEAGIIYNHKLIGRIIRTYVDNYKNRSTGGVYHE